MSKLPKRKITVNISPKPSKLLPKTRPSVFERLGTKANPTHKEFCHHWAQHGNCPFGKGCKYSVTHILISPSKKRAAKKENETKKRHRKENTHKRVHTSSTKVAQSLEEDWNQWDPHDLEAADPDDLEKRRLELHRQLELQMKMENKARKKKKASKLESSGSSVSSSSSTDSTSSTDDSSSSSSTSVETSHQTKKKKEKKRDSSSSTDAERVQKQKAKIKYVAAARAKNLIEKAKKRLSPAKSFTIIVKSPSPLQMVKLSQTPPPKLKPFLPVDKSTPLHRSPPKSLLDQKEKHIASPKVLVKEKELEREKILKDREREKEKEKEREKEREREKEKEREKEREKEKERERERIREREKERQKELERKKRETRSPRRDSRSTKESKRRDTPEPSHSRDRKQSPSRSRGSEGSRRSNSRKKSPTSTYKDDRYSAKRVDDKFRGRGRPNDRGRRDQRISRDREKERERRITREEREAAREKERSEALARCQERQRERERIKELQRKEEEQRNRDRNAREDRGLDKPTGDRVERLLPLPADRIPANRRDRSLEKDRDSRDRNRINRRARSPNNTRNQTRKPFDRHNRINRDNRNDRSRPEHVYDRGYDRNDRGPRYDRDRSREYSHLHEVDRRQDGSPYDRNRRDDRHYHELDERYNENSREEHLADTRDYPDDRRSHREMWDVERDVDHDREIEPRRFGRDDSRPLSGKDRDWEVTDYPEHEWDRTRRPLDWEGRNWDAREDHPPLEDEWRPYNRSVDSWEGEDNRRQWSDWRGRSGPRSTASHQAADDAEAKVPTKEQEKVDPTHEETQPKKDSKPVGKKPITQPSENVAEVKVPCVNEITEDDFSEISDDADEILNREEDILVEESSLLADSNSKSSEKEVSDTKSVIEPSNQPVTESAPQALAVRNPSPPSTIPTTVTKEESIEEENIDLDFEEISEDELEEETRIKGLGDVLGVDWASLVAESRPRAKPICSAKRRWESHNVLVNLGMSVEMAGEDLVKSVLKEHAKAKMNEEADESEVNKNEEECESSEKEVAEIEISHPVAAIQVAIREKEAMRKSLFASAGPYRRALSARRDLAIRRHLCNLPVNDMFVETPRQHDPELFEAALELFERNL